MANIQNVRTINNPQKSYMWEVEVHGLASGVLSNFSFFAKTVNIPQTAVETITINHKAAKTHFAGRDSSAHTCSITFWDDENATIQKFFKNWMDIIRNPITGSGITRDLYSSDLVIKLKDETDNSVTATITLGHAFPTEMGDITLNYDGSEAIEISVTLTYDEKIIA